MDTNNIFFILKENLYTKKEINFQEQDERSLKPAKYNDHCPKSKNAEFSLVLEPLLGYQKLSQCDPK